MQLNPSQQATLDQATEALGATQKDYGIMAAAERIGQLSWHLGNLVAMISQLEDQPSKDQTFHAVTVKAVLDLGWQVTSYKTAAGNYYIVLTGPDGTFSGETPDFYEALSHAVIASGIQL